MAAGWVSASTPVQGQEDLGAQDSAVAGSTPPLRPEASTGLSWSGPEGCNDPALLQRRFEQLIGEQPLEKELGAHSIVTRRGQAWVVRIHIEYDKHRGRRELEAASCLELVDAAALLLALTVGRAPDLDADPDTAAQTGSKASNLPPPTADDLPGPGGSPAAAPELTEGRPRPRSWRLTAEAWGALGFGVLRPAHGGFGVGAGVELQTVELTLAAQFWPTARVRELSVAGSAAKVSRFDLGLRACGWPFRRGVELGLCTTLGASQLRVSTNHIQQPGEATRWLPFGALGIPIRVRLAEWAHVQTTPALLWTHAHDFVVRGIEETAFSSRSWSASWALGVGARF